MSKNYEATCQDDKDCTCLPGVRCEAKSCVHNDQHCGCTAGQIQVGSAFATKSDQTTCDTFRQK